MNTGSLEKRALELLSEALDQPSDMREEWVHAASDGNVQLEARVLSLLQADAGSERVLRTGGAGAAMAEPDMPERVGAYKITGRIGQGGMGAVYEGKRDANDFDHRVAIKVIRPGVLSEALVERFQRERQILASLSHPHIARLYDGGETADGAPFMVMEYVDGQPVTEWAKSHALSLSDRLWLFSDICSAVRHAHQNLIIHRDITPSNVLVTEDGGIKLIDFGIAKPHAVDAPVSATGADVNSLASLSFTPGYAAPERSKGAAANTLSDVYSLGKLLEALVKDKASNADLQAIISWATAHDPGARYASVDALLDDLGNLQKGRTVEARRGGALYRFAKFARRRKYIMAATAMVFAGLAGGLAVTTNLYQQAESARAQAATRFSETRELTGFLLNDLNDELENVPGALAAQEKLTETSARYLDILAKAAASDDSVKLDYAIGRGKLGEVMTAAGGANLGNPEKGIENLRESLKLLEELAANTPDDPDILFALADVESDYGYAMAYHLGASERGAQHLAIALKTYQSALALQPENIRGVVNQAQAQLVGFYLSDIDAKDAPQRFDEMEAQWQDIQARFPGADGILPGYTTFLRLVANFELDRWNETFDENVPMGERIRYEKALSRIRKSVELAEQMLAVEPVNQQHIYQLVWSEEIEALLMVLSVAWEPDFEEAIGLLSAAGQSSGRPGVFAAMQASEVFAGRRARGAVVTARMDASDAMLARIAPYDGETFTHIEAVYYNLKARAYAEAQLRMDMEASQRQLDAALDLTTQLLIKAPEMRQWRLERTSTLTEKAYLLARRSVLYGENLAPQICALVSEAANDWQDLRKLDDAFEGYASYEVWNSEIGIEVGCTH